MRLALVDYLDSAERRCASKRGNRDGEKLEDESEGSHGSIKDAEGHRHKEGCYDCSRVGTVAGSGSGQEKIGPVSDGLRGSLWALTAR